MGESHTDDRTPDDTQVANRGAPIRLALVITELAVGGAERCLVNLALGLDRRKYAPVVYSLASRPAVGQTQLVDSLEAADAPVRFVNTNSKWQLFSAIGKLSRLFTDDRVSLVQTFLHHANVVGTLAGRRSGVRQIVTNIRVADPRRGRQQLERFVTRNVSKVVCVSNSVARFAATNMGYANDQLLVIPNGIETSQYPATTSADLRQLGLPENRRAMVCVGRLDRQKGIDRLLPLCPPLFQQFADVDLLLVGDGPERSRLESQARTLGISSRVHFAGWQSGVREILRACELLVLPSRWEGMPNVLLEAMASELPVVATQVEGVVEVLGPLSDLQSTSTVESHEFLLRIATILQDPSLARSLGEQNRARIEAQFSLSTMIRAYERLYDSLVQGS